MFQPEFVCRVCLAEGGWNIFGTIVAQDGMCTVASVNHIQEKLQYVTQLEVNENDGLPLKICELCIIQLNVSYRFKQLANESDRKLRQSHEANERLPAVPNALTEGEKGDVPENEAEPKLVLVKVEEFPDEISIGTTTLIEERTDSYIPVHEVTVPNRFDGMVCLQKDIINPAEDEAYMEDILNNEVISIPCFKNNKKSTNPQHPPASPTIPPDQSKEQQKAAKSSRQHERSKSKTPPSENDSRDSIAAPTASKPKNPKHKENQSTTPKRTPKRSSSSSSSSSSSIGSTKKIKKSTKVTLRKQRLEKIFNQLRIDMTFNNTVEWQHLKELQATPNAGTLADPPLPKLPMKRRNSVCVSSFAPWR